MTVYNSARHVVSGGHEIHVQEAGNGPAVVFIHGSGPGASGASNFRQNIEAFVGAGYRVILPDMIGYGASSKPEGLDYSLDLFTDTLYEALVAHGIETATLVGNSLGGGVAIQMALNHPAFVDKLIMMAPGCIEERETYFAMPGIAKMVSAFGSPDFSIEDQRRLVTNLVYDASNITDTLVAERYAVAKTQPKDVLVRMRVPNLAPRLGELTQPILGFWGLNDEFCPSSGARYFLEQCADARFLTFNKVGHWVMVERAAEFNAYAIGFLRDHR
jgi:4,5:9,10-diseco-3-hydroxy-5,9,17-trioxoandrosta-1(10),2-diene-4-oate hydrolase